jgi:4-oxalomesaconate tautomerase
VLTLNTGMQCDVTVQTPDGRLQYTGDARIDGVPGTAAPISINFLDTAGSVCPSLLPSGRVLDRIKVDGADAFEIDATLIDNGMPMVLVRAADMGVSGYEGVAELNANDALKAKAGSPAPDRRPADGPGRRQDQELPEDVPGRAAARRRQRRHPLLHPACVPRGDRRAGSRHRRHRLRAGRFGHAGHRRRAGACKTVSVEHPTGEFSVELELDANDPQKVVRAALLRTARPIMRGEVLISEEIWRGE